MCWPPLYDSKVFCRVNYKHSLLCPCPVHLTIYYTAVTDRWHSLWQTQEELRWSGQQRLCPCPVYVVDSWGHPIDSPDRAAALEALKAQKLSPTPPGQMSVLQDSHSDTHMHTNTQWYREIGEEPLMFTGVFQCANIRFWHQNQHCWRASTPALFELTEAHSTSLESYSWDKDNNGFLVLMPLKGTSSPKHLRSHIFYIKAWQNQRTRASARPAHREFHHERGWDRLRPVSFPTAEALEHFSGMCTCSSFLRRLEGCCLFFLRGILATLSEKTPDKSLWQIIHRLHQSTYC